MWLLGRLTLIVLLAVKVHYVFLSWSASADAGPGLTYSVYRAVSAQPCPAAGDPSYQLLVRGLYYRATNYFDKTVTSGNSYCYEIYSMLNGVMSAPAGPVGVTEP